ncbi:AP2/ERF and B3 domain-containing transcription factor like protein [Tanacetum coccineum]
MKRCESIDVSVHGTDMSLQFVTAKSGGYVSPADATNKLLDSANHYYYPPLPLSSVIVEKELPDTSLVRYLQKEGEVALCGANLSWEHFRLIGKDPNQGRKLPLQENSLTAKVCNRGRNQHSHKHNRLVIPKKHAVMYFPPLPDPDTDKSHGFANDEVILSFYDVQKKLWKFRYCYWKRSQSFVFTRGWNQFVKEKGLVENDKVRFYFLENPGMQNLGFYIIDTDTDLSMSNIGASLKLGLGTQVKCIVPKEEEASLKHGLGTQVKYIVPKDEEGIVEDHETKDEVIQASNVETKGIKLFGVQIA